MRRIFPYILIVLIAVQLFAPFSIGSGKNSNLQFKSNKAEANWVLPGYGTDPIKITSDFKANDTSIRIIVEVGWPNKRWDTAEEVHVLKVSDTQPDPSKTTYDKDVKVALSDTGNGTQSGYADFDGLTPLKTYKFVIRGTQNSTTVIQNVFNLVNTVAYTIVPIYTSKEYLSENTGEVQNTEPYEVTTLSKGITTYQKQDVPGAIIKNDAALLPECALNNLGGCVGIVLYRLLFQPSSFIFALTGRIFDFTFNYSIQDASYRGQFVVQGWATIRDVCNMFFIFVLLYIAVGTILKLDAVKTKEMIISVVIIGLFINFSLFATQVVIDSSNILARVFYNQITVGHLKAGVVEEELDSFGNKQVSAIIVNKVNPQRIIMSAEEANSANIESKNANFTQKNEVVGVDNGTFIMITLLATAVNVFGLIAFITSSVIFIVRVVGLWLAMIFVPIAFFTYTIPQAQDIESIGWKKWWPETLKLAFLAPVFIFFIYLICQFLNTGLGVIDASNKSGLSFYVAVLVPFIILIVLLMQAKKIAVKMSGKMGETVMSAASSVGKFALGTGLAAATGGASMLMRGTLGRMASQAADNDKLKEKAKEGGLGGFSARMKLQAANFGKKATFDVRNTKLGKLAGSGMGVDVGKVKEGGYAGYQERSIKKEIAKADMLKLSNSDALKQDEAARVYNTAYIAAMAKDKKAKEDAGEVFNEKVFKDSYETTNGPKVKNAEGINKDRMKARADSAQTEFFVDNQVKAGVIADLKKKGTPEKPPLNPVEVYNANKTKDKSIKELANIDTDIKNLISEVRNGHIQPNEVNKTHIESEINARGVLMADQDTQIGQAQAALSQNPYNAKAKQDLMDANKAKKQLETEIRKLGSILDNKEKHKSIVEQQGNILASNIQK